MQMLSTFEGKEAFKVTSQKLITMKYFKNNSKVIKTIKV